MRARRLFRVLLFTIFVLASGRAAHAASITLAWDPDTSGTVTGYVLYWGTVSGQYSQSMTLGRVSSATINTAMNETMIYFAVKAFNPVGMSAMSTEAAAWVGTVWRTPTLMRGGDFDGDGKADAMIYRGTTGQWFASSLSGSTTWGAPSLGDIPVPADYDGDGKSDFAVYRNTSGGWFLNQSRNGGLTVLWGAPAYGDIPVPDDYDGDGKADIAVFRRNTGEWLVRQSTTGNLQKVAWGGVGNDDVPVPGDYNGNGKADFAVYRRSSGQWFVQFDNGVTTSWTWGTPSQADVPVPADYDGDGLQDIAVFRQASGAWIIHLSANNATVNHVWGAPQLGDVPVPGDYDGDGKADIAVFRTSTGNWYIAQSRDGGRSFAWGAPSVGDTVGGMKEVSILPVK